MHRRSHRYDPEKVQGRAALQAALTAAGFRYDPRAKLAMKLPGHEDWRVDLGGKISARLERHYVGAWRGHSDTIYYGKVGSHDFARAWAAWAAATIRGTSSAEPRPVVSERAKAAAGRRREKAAAERAKTSGPGLYVTNANAGAKSAMLYSRIANHGPYQSMDKAVDKAFDVLKGHLEMRLTYLLPVEVVEGRSREEVERGGGYVWWINGKRRAAPVHPRQTAMPWADPKRSRVHHDPARTERHYKRLYFTLMRMSAQYRQRGEPAAARQKELEALDVAHAAIQRGARWVAPLEQILPTRHKERR